MTTNADGRPRVLIVEDDLVTSLDLSNELTGMGYEVCGFVDTAADAIRMAAQACPALVLMDVRLAHGGDGVETARVISSRHDTAIVFMTADSDESTLARAVDVSPAGYLIKPFRARDLKVAIELALAKHARDAAAVRHLQSQATTDPLTGLANRRQLDTMLEAEWQRCRETGRSLALVMIDIDHFKAFNDVAGHLAGDVCLVKVADALRDACHRSGAVLGRWGGEEFVAVLPGADLEEASNVGEQIVRTIREARLFFGSSPPRGLVTVSAGVSAAIPGTEGSVLDLLNLADRGLYAAKRAGRDRVALVAQ